MRAGTLLLDRYLVEVELGRGGQGTVYRARDTRLGRRRLVAVKSLEVTSAAPARHRWMMAKRFDRETEILADLHHDHIVTVYDRGEHGGTPLLVMEYVAGPSLAQRMREPAPLAAADVVAWGAQTAKGLLAAHQAGVSHRDIKPSNLLISAAGLVKICDFGLVTRPSPQTTMLTVRGAGMLGSPGYMSPEQAACEPGDGRSDVFSLGVTLYALLAGGSPFAAEHPEESRTRVLSETPSPVSHWRPDTPATLSDLLAHMMTREPAGRPNLREILARLNEVALRQAPVAAVHEETAPMAPPRPSPGLALAPALAPERDEREVPTGVRGQDVRDASAAAPGRDERNGKRSGDLAERYWPRLEEAERLLVQRKFEQADEMFRRLALDITAEGGRAQQHAAFFAALYGRVRAMEGRGRRVQAAQRLARLRQRVGQALGPRHPLARVVTEHRRRHAP
jgi:hypothetical protein